MAKKNVTIRLDEDLISLAKATKINISEISGEALESAVTVTLAHMKECAQSIEERIKEKQETEDVIHREQARFKAEKARHFKDMRIHVKAAKEAGIPRGQAEMDFGHVFPDAIWDGEM
jgi:post-segregation antitoxin (ccd killing protein)